MSGEAAKDSRHVQAALVRNGSVTWSEHRSPPAAARARDEIKGLFRSFVLDVKPRMEHADAEPDDE